MRQLRGEGVALIYISHRMPEIRALADNVAVLRDGRLVAHRRVAEVTEADIVQLMVGRPVSTLFQRRPVPTGPVVLEARGLTTARVHDVSLSIRAGEVVGLGGLIGAGRSELALAIFGQDRLLSGTVAVGGMTVRLRSPADAIAAGIGLAPEDRKGQALLLLRSVADNITLCVPDRISRFGLLSRAAELRIAGEQAAHMRIKTPSLDQLISKLSGGNQQKVVLGRWLARAPRVLILDEPTRGIDVGAKAEIYQLVAQLAAQGIAILVISSELPELIGLCDRILVMAAGRIDRRSAAGGRERTAHPATGDARKPVAGRRLMSGHAAAPPQARGLGGRGPFARAVGTIGTHNFSLLIALAILVAIFGALRPDVFFLARNIQNIGQAIAILGVLATAQTIVIVSGGLDISVGSVVGMSTVCIATVVAGTGSTSLSIAAGIGVGAVAGLVNALIITRRRRQRGDRDARHDGGVPRRRLHHQRRPVDPDLRSGFPLHRRRPVPRRADHDRILLAMVARVLRADALHGRRPQHLRHRRQSAGRAAGRPDNLAYQIGIYALSGATAGLAGMLLAARTGSGQPVSGSQGAELEAITAAVLGGCALTGGRGTDRRRACSAC